jgi:hypothetical protein
VVEGTTFKGEEIRDFTKKGKKITGFFKLGRDFADAVG